MNDQPSNSSGVTNTGDGPYIQGNVNTDGGDFVGRDKNTNIFNYLFGSTLETGQHLRARKILLENVQKFWVEGVLKHSLYNEVLLTIGLEEKPSVVDNRPWDTVLQTPEQPDRPLPHGMKIIDVFDQQQQSLLILGAPGSGKTTILLELARDLITRAQQDITQPIPVVLNLSSWSVQRQLLADWIIAELNSKYYIAPKVAQSWVENDALLLLLDGLDEVQQAHRGACVAAINTFRKTHVVSLAVCSRMADYDALEQPLQLQGAVFVQPLRQEQVDEYFIQLGPEYMGARAIVRHNPVFHELAESPLMLSVMTLAYRGIDIESVEPQCSAFAHRQYLFDMYIRRMFSRREPLQLYSPQQTLHWLTWLAVNIVQRQQTIFLIERLQPDWLPERAQTWLYRLSVGLLGGLLIGLVVGLLVVLTFGLLGGILIASLVGLVFVLLGTLLGTLFGVLNPQLSRRIVLTERLVFTWRLDKPILLGALISGLIAILIFGLLRGLIFGLIVGLFVGLLVVLSQLLKKDEAAQSIYPNQGIWHSARNAFIIALRVGLFFGFIVGLIAWLNGGMSSVLSGGLVVGMSGGVLFGLIEYGGVTCIQHIGLRSLLILSNHAPLNYARFLDYCADRIFLRKVGGGYIFVHRLLLEHFASLTCEDIERIAAVPKEPKTT